VRQDALRDAAKTEQAAGSRRRLTRVQFAANNGGDTICADYEIRPHRAATGTRHFNCIIEISKPRHLAAKLERASRQRVEQRAVQHGPQHRDRRLGQQIANALQLEAAQHGAVHAPHLAIGRHVPAADNRISDTQPSQRMHRIRGEQQREPELARTRGAFEHSHTPTRTVQRNRCRQTADTSPDDYRLPMLPARRHEACLF
jgi:hypothetical protein